MVVDENIPTLSEWLLPSATSAGALLYFVVVILLLGMLGMLITYLIQTVRYGPIAAAGATGRALADSVLQMAMISPRRVLAIASVAFKESIRRWVLVVFVIFMIIVLLGGWFLDVQGDNPLRLYLRVVLFATNFLVLMLALLLSSFSLPADIEKRTIYTVLTKPVRTIEVVAGRVVGFAAIGTLLLLVMGGISYIFVVRGMAHTHEINADELAEADGSGSAGAVALEGRTSLNHHHRHHVELNADGVGYTDLRMEHRHRVRRIESGGKVRYEVGPVEGAFQSRVPLYGQIQFFDRTGAPSAKGISVGNEWAYRSFIEGNTEGAANWTFDGITPEAFPADQFPQGLPLELNIRVFRTHKGNIEEPIHGSITLINPDPDQARPLETEPIVFGVREFTADRRLIPRKLTARNADGTVRDVDLMNDVVHDGRLIVRIQCIEPAQYFGVAQADVYFRAADTAFGWNFAKGFISIWLQMLLVIVFGVAFSTILSAPVTMLATLSSIILGYFSQFVLDVASGKIMGGGPVEAAIRTVTQKNVMVELDSASQQEIVRWGDWMILAPMRLMANLLPHYDQLSTTQYVAYGYNIPGSLLAQHLLTTLAYVLVVTTIGYILLKSREIAA